jgi:2-polyprenyl-3-methyl-5-hydroxy-6-metoxy-1,4-benzoquinol methylase
VVCAGARAADTDVKHRTGDSVQIPGEYQARALVSDRAAQRFWHEAKFRTLERLLPPRRGGRIADVGCGSGTLSEYLARAATHVVAIDGNPAAVEYARRAFPRSNLEFVLGQFDALRDYGPFDQLYCIEVLEHLYADQARATLRLFREISRPGATLFLTTPNYRSAWPAIEWGLDRLSLVPTLDGDQHVTHFTRARLAAACRDAGWDIADLGTFNGAAPFLAPLGQRLALAAERIEFAGRHVLPLNLLYCVATARDGAA